MRDYRKKMQRYKLDKERYDHLRTICRQAESAEIVESAISAVGEPGLSFYLRMHVTKGWKWRRLAAAGVPCSGDTFRVYRAKFYWYLNALENGAKKKAPGGVS